jgi:hypothetical protein
MPTTWTIAIDWDRDGDYTDTYDDVTDRVMSADWFLGMRQPYQETEDGSQLTLVLNNTDRRFSPEYSSSPLNGKVVSNNGRNWLIRRFDIVGEFV